jgi:hypothetical protein
MRAASVLNEDGKGGYRFDRMALPGPFDILGFAPSLHERADHGGKRAICTKYVTATSSSYRKKTAQKEELRSV